MKKISRTLLCAALTGAVAVGAAGAANLGSLTPQGAKAYLDQITALQNQYGKAVSRTDEGFQGLTTRFSMSKLVDMDGDGTPELYCGAYPDGQSMYTYENNALKQLAIPKSVSNFGNDVSPCVNFYIGKDKAYLVDGHETISGNPVTFLTKQGDEIVTALTYKDGYDWDTDQPILSVNGKNVTADELNAAIADFTKGMTEEYYSYWDYLGSPYAPEGILSVRASLTDTITSLRTLTNPTAKVSTHKVSLNGKSVALGAYTINRNNYFKLRDLAKALDGLNTNFEVQWNAKEQRIDLTSKTAYTSVGGEQAALPAGSKAASLTNASVYLDGKPLNLTAYSIGGNNYFKLRDLGDALDFDVDWDAATTTMILTVK